jgi:hypothetical protein
VRKSTIVILVLIGAMLVLTPTESTNSADNFNNFRPYAPIQGCHDATTANERADGTILFESSWLQVGEGEEFTLTATVFGFSGNVDVQAKSNGDISIGFNILDEDNGKFLTDTISETNHLLDVNGDSVTPWITPTFTAPTGVDVQGNYSLVAYGVAGDVDNFNLDWVVGQVRVEVVAPSGPPGPIFQLALGEIANDNVNVTIDILSNFTDVKSIQLAVDNKSDYKEISLVSNYKYRLELGQLTPGEHIIYVNITNFADASTEHEISIIVPGEVTTPSTSETTSTPPVTSSQQTVTDKVDHGVFSDPIVLGGLVVVMVAAIAAPWVLLRRS